MRKYRDKCNDKCTMKIFYFQLFGEYDITWLTQINNLLVKSSTNFKKIFLYNRNCKCALLRNFVFVLHSDIIFVHDSKIIFVQYKTQVTLNSSVNFVIYCIFGDKFKRFWRPILGKNHSLSSFDFNLLTFVLLPHILSSSFLVLTISSPTESSPTFSSQCWVSESPLPLTKTFFSTDLARSIRPSVDPIELWKGWTKMQLGLDLTKIVDKEKFTTTKSCFRIIVCYFC